MEGGIIEKPFLPCGGVKHVKPVYRLAFLLSGAFALGIIAGNGVNLRDSRAYSFITEDKSPGGNKNLPGYKGLIPGYIPGEPPANGAPPQSAGAQSPVLTPTNPAFVIPSGPQPAPRETAAMSVDPKYAPPRKISTIEDMNIVGLTKPLRIDWKTANIPPEVASTLSGMLTPRDIDTLGKPRFRIEGMLPEEYTTKSTIDNVMKIVDDPSVAIDVRKANARKATEKLREYANSLQTRENLPDAVFQQMGVPDSYLQSEHENLRNSLNRVDAALRTLKKYE